MIKFKTIKAQIPRELIAVGNNKLKRKDTRRNLFKMYAIIKYHYQLELKRNDRRSNPKMRNLVHVPLSSIYFEKVIAKRYYKYKRILQDEGFIGVKSRMELRPGVDLFAEFLVETYTVGKVAKGYKILELDNPDTVEMEFDLEIEYGVAATKNINFLESVGITHPSITYDKYGYRLYHNLTTIYKCFLDRENFICYDIKSSVPSFMKILMEREEIQSDPYFDLFDGDFYINLGVLMGFNGTREEIRKQAKKLFMHVAYGNRRIAPAIERKLKDKLPLFDLMTRRKGIGRDLIQMEASFINQVVLPSIDIDRVMTIFDALVIYKEDELVADEFIRQIELLNDSIKFEKDGLPACEEIEEEEVSYAV